MISYGVWLYHVLSPSLRDAELLLAERTLHRNPELLFSPIFSRHSWRNATPSPIRSNIPFGLHPFRQVAPCDPSLPLPARLAGWLC